MNRRSRLVAVAMLTATPAFAGPIVTTDLGKVEGVADGAATSFKAIPFAAAAGALVLTSFALSGSVAAYGLIAVGLANSITFPTIFSLAVEGLGDRAPQGSGLLCTAIVGGAVIPAVIGAVADMTSLKTALILPAVCYVLIASYGWYARRPVES